MAWSDGALDGAVLAATLHEDRMAAAARGLVPQVAAALEARLEALGAEPTARRRAEIHRLAAALRAAPDPDAVLPARARAVLAADVPRAVGARWMAEAPPPRRGFAAGPALKATLRRLAGAAGPALDRSPTARAERELRELEEAGCLE